MSKDLPARKLGRREVILGGAAIGALAIVRPVGALADSGPAEGDAIGVVTATTAAGAKSVQVNVDGLLMDVNADQFPDGWQFLEGDLLLIHTSSRAACPFIVMMDGDATTDFFARNEDASRQRLIASYGPGRG